jgi:hypothetical protein
MVCHRVDRVHCRTFGHWAIAGLIAAVAMTAARPATSAAAEIRPGLSVPAYTFVRVTPAEGERIFVLPIPSVTKTPWPSVEVIQAASGESVFVGSPGLYAVLWFSDATQGQAFVRILPPGPNPGPDPPGPDPEPDVPEGFAGEVYRKAREVGDKPRSAAVAGVFRNVHGKIGTELTTVQAIYDYTRTLTSGLAMPPDWSPFNQWLSAQLKAKAQTPQQAKPVYRDIVLGLEAAAK